MTFRMLFPLMAFFALSPLAFSAEIPYPSLDGVAITCKSQTTVPGFSSELKVDFENKTNLITRVSLKDPQNQVAATWEDQSPKLAAIIWGGSLVSHYKLTSRRGKQMVQIFLWPDSQDLNNLASATGRFLELENEQTTNELYPPLHLSFACEIK